MLTTVQLFLNGIVVLLLPLVAFSILKGSPAPRNTFLTKYYDAEKYLNLTGNLFLLSLIATSASKLAAHFGLIDQASMDALDPYIQVPFLVLLAAFLILWVRAALKVRGLEKKAS